MREPDPTRTPFGIATRVAVLAVGLVALSSLLVGLVGDLHVREVLARTSGEDAAQVTDVLLRLRVKLALATGGLLIGATAIAIALARLLTRPLVGMAAAATAMSEGRYDMALPVRRRDEIGLLARAMRAMATRIHERTRESAAARRAMQAILHSTPDAMLGVDATGTIVFANGSAGELFGYPGDTLEGRPVSDLIPENLRARHAEHIRHYGENPSRRTMGEGRELLARRADGTLFPVEVSLSPVTLPTGRITVSAIRDVTARRTQESDLVQARERALSASRAKGDFLARMSHEIRTPMNAIIGTAELLSETRLDEVQERYVGMLRRAGDNLLTLLNDILDLARIESGRLHIRPRPFLLAELLERIAELLEAPARARGLDLRLSVDATVPPVVEGDPDRLRQILLNLVNNAIKFTPAGRIEVRVAPSAEAEPETRIRFSVRDTGIGIPADKLDTIFESFAQVDASMTRPREGAGLGLSICRQLAQRMGGRIWAESASAGGSTFHVELPLPAAVLPPEAVEEDEAAPRINFQGTRVLLATADPTERVLLDDTLHGWSITVTPCGPTGAMPRALAETQPDLIVCALPDGMDAATVAGGLTAGTTDGRTPPILWITSEPLDAERLGLRPGHAQRVLLRPVKRTELFQALSALLAPAVPPATAAPHALLPADALPPLRILLAEDSEDNRQIVLAYLADTDCVVDCVGDGLEAVARHAAEPYDVVLMDVQMPVQDGYGAIRDIRAIEAAEGRRRVPILVLTAHALATERRRTYEAGGDAHLAKPVRKAELLAALARLAADMGARPLTPTGELEELVRRRLPAYIQSRREEWPRMEAHLRAAEWEPLRRLAHQWKGHAAIYGFPALGRYAADLEVAAVAGDTPAATRAARRLADAVTRLAPG